MTDEEIKLRCIEIAIASTRCTPRSMVIHADMIFKVVSPYIREGKLPD